MDNLALQVQTISSLEVAEMLETEHWKILRKLDGSDEKQKGIIEILTDNNFVVSDYFIESTYKDRSGKENRCYLITKMGCEFLANKFTGEKGVIFSAKYVKKFNEMEQHIQQALPYSNLSPQLQLLINIETEQKLQAEAIESTNKRIDSMQDIIRLDTTSWRKDAKALITRIAMKLGGFEYISEVNKEINKLVDMRGGVSLETRLTNKRRRMAEEGICKSKRDKVTKVDIIADDKKLIEIYLSIVKEIAVKYGISE